MLFALIGGLCACSDDNENPQPPQQPEEEYAFVGALEVTPEEGSRFEAFGEQDIAMELQGADDGTLTLMMPEIKFVPQMPWLSIEVRGLVKMSSEDGFSFSVEHTIPYFMGAPYESYPITNLQGSYSASQQSLLVEFDCNTMHVTYNGRR